ncbi:MAG: GGDEF domain-containing protein [Rhizobiales bacterium 65-79]|nr:MAG: GGDEF domain-containing protein [Rhizobiales bacterium 65-79]
MANGILLLVEALFYFGAMALMFRLRRQIGIGVFMCALGVMHFLETYLASVFYVAVPVGLLSPGSTVLFSGKLVMLLLLYIKEDAATVRQPIYGLLLGNALTVGLVLLLRMQHVSQLPGENTPDIAFIDQMGWLMVWGTTLLFVDSIFIILLYEKLGKMIGRALLPRVMISVGCVLTFDQVGFFTALHFYAGAPVAVFFGGWAAKMCAALFYSVLMVGYLKWFEAGPLSSMRGLTDIFDTLTYREKYEALVEHAGRDSLTGLLHRGRFETLGEQAVAGSMRGGRTLSLLVIDVDHFKSINDRLGHSEGDRVLKSIASAIAEALGTDDRAFRIGGEEFAVLCPLPHPVARLLGENIRQRIGAFDAGDGIALSVSVGVASMNGGISSLAQLFAVADRRLYAAKSDGRNRVVGDRGQDAAEAIFPQAAGDRPA